MAEAVDLGSSERSSVPTPIPCTRGCASAARFPAPDRFDIRRDARGRVAFGHGIHYCLGAPLARLEACTAIRSLLERAPGLALGGAPGEWLPGPMVRGVRTLPVRW